MDAHGPNGASVAIGTKRLVVARLAQARIGLGDPAVVLDKMEVMGGTPRRQARRNELGNGAIDNISGDQTPGGITRVTGATGVARLFSIMARETGSLARQVVGGRQPNLGHVAVAGRTVGTAIEVELVVKRQVGSLGLEPGSDATGLGLGVADLTVVGPCLRFGMLGAVTAVARLAGRKVKVGRPCTCKDIGVALGALHAETEVPRVVEAQRDVLIGVHCTAELTGADNSRGGRDLPIGSGLQDP